MVGLGAVTAGGGKGEGRGRGGEIHTKIQSSLFPALNWIPAKHHRDNHSTSQETFSARIKARQVM